MKLCKDCIWFADKEPAIQATCLSPHLGVTPVHGIPIVKYCLTERRDGKCGPKGKYFAPKEQDTMFLLTKEVKVLRIITTLVILAYLGKLAGLY